MANSSELTAMTREELDEAVILARIGVKHNRPGAAAALADLLVERCRRTATLKPTYAEQMRAHNAELK